MYRAAELKLRGIFLTTKHTKDTKVGREIFNREEREGARI
jgi:hypothetical protein